MGKSVDQFVAELPDQTGKVAVVTGANSGIGLEACVMLAKRGARVVMACRTPSKAEAARADVVKRAGCAADKVAVVALDLSSLESAKTFRARYEAALGGAVPCDMLILNAGVMALNSRELTKDGHEMQMGTNNFGHFAVLAGMLDLVERAPAGRVVHVSSGAHHLVNKISFDDLDRAKTYAKWSVYGETKLGNLLVANKLGRLLEERGVTHVKSVACHPGYTATNLQAHTVFSFTNYLFAQAAPMGATPTVLAATDAGPAAVNGAYAGPWLWGWIGMAHWGEAQSKAARNVKLQDDFWAACERATGVSVDVGRAPKM